MASPVLSRPSRLGSRLKPRWLSLTWANVKLAVAAAGAFASPSLELAAAFDRVKTRTPVEEWAFARDYAVPLLERQMGAVSLDGFGFAHHAVAAIAAGLQILCARRGARVEDLDRVYLAGAFGNYVRVASAEGIGLLQMDPERVAFWHEVWLGLTAESLKRLIFRKFKKDITLRLGIDADAVENVEVSVHMSLARDIEDYRIDPHPDGWPAIVTAQFYLPADMSQKDLGTSFYIERPLLRRAFLGRYEELKRMPFATNSGYFFAVNDLPGHRSLHGRERIRAGAGVRNTMLVRWSIPSPTRKEGRQGISPTHQFL